MSDNLVYSSELGDLRKDNSQILKDDPEECSIKFWVRTYRTPFYIEKTSDKN